MKVPTLKKYREDGERLLLKDVLAEDLTYSMDTKPIDEVISILEDRRTRYSEEYDNLSLDIYSKEQYYGEVYLYIQLLGDRLERDCEFDKRTRDEWRKLKKQGVRY